MPFTFRRFGGIGVVLVLLAGSALFAQQAAGLRGAVRDESGAFIPGVLVTVTNEGTGVAREAVTNERGRYNFPVLQPGTYTISAELAGFKRSTVTNFLIETATVKQAKFVLEIGSITDQITVTSESVQQVQFETSDLGDVVFERKIRELPLNGRRPIELVLLQPGMAGNPGQGNAGGFAASGGR